MFMIQYKKIQNNKNNPKHFKIMNNSAKILTVILYHPPKNLF
jgi:hypothetical protein